MTKSDVVDRFATEADVSKNAAKEYLDTLLEVITKALASGEKVTLTGFGTFEVRQRAARMGRNPQTGEPIHIPATKTPAFRAGKTLKDDVRS